MKRCETRGCNERAHVTYEWEGQHHVCFSCWNAAVKRKQVANGRYRGASR